MAWTVQFVDSIASSPTVRLNLNDTSTWTVREMDLSPPAVRRAVAGSLLANGEHIAASALSNRTLTLSLFVEAASADALGTQLQALARELHRERNFLKIQPDGATAPVFARTFRSPDFRVDDVVGNKMWLTVPLLAEPPLYGTKETPVSAVDINNDPAHATNPMVYDVTGVKGDYATPAQITVEDAAGDTMLLYVAIRSRGTPSNLTHFRQAESMTLGTDASLQAIAGFSGSGNTGVRISFAGSNDIGVARLTQSAFLGSSSADIRGDYKLLVRLARNGGGGTDDFQVKGTLGSAGDVKTVADLTGPQWVDLGKFSIPGAAVVPYDGYSGSELSSESPQLGFFATRSGTASLDVDDFFVLPADEALCIASFGSSISATGSGVLDGPLDAAYTKNSGGAVDNDVVARESAIPSLIPNQTNRLYLIRSRSLTSDVLTDDFNLTVNYWPLYETIRPAAS